MDQIVVENGMRPNEDLYYALKASSRNKGQIDNEALVRCKTSACS